MTDKNTRGKPKTRGQGRLSVHSRLGAKPGPMNSILQGPRMVMFPRGMVSQQHMRMGPQFQNSQNRGQFPGMINQRGPFPLRLINQRAAFPQEQRIPFLGGQNNQRPSFPGVPNLLSSAAQRTMFSPLLSGRFPGPPNQRGQIIGQQQRGPILQNQRGPVFQQNLRGSQTGPQFRGPVPNQAQGPQNLFNQRMQNVSSMRLPIGQNIRISMSGGPGQSPRPLMGPNNQMRMNYPGVSPSQGQPIPSLVKPVSTPPQSLMNFQPGEPPRLSPHQRLGRLQVQNRQSQPNGQQGSGFFFRAPAPGMLGVGQVGSQFQAQNEMQMMKKHKIYINPRFQNHNVRPQVIFISF